MNGDQMPYAISTMEKNSTLARSRIVTTQKMAKKAVREKLESIKVIDIRDVSKEKTKKEVIEYLKENKKAYPSDVADALQLDFDLVLSIVKELIKEGRVK